ncbi:hypothetical protein EXU57_09475 [Segetibacter sp. 3557_3]|uniref:glycosyl hydrolase 115 family protein n=1 Tax=Segetibacter sp. 3557_3 TaxID=2547429 RepID=UPI00105857E0|nr:glycosyl hydrolase 115 family protein [Segetibacter sp. 3557_3]TDH27021.1 hypothetical protein EXU57_09475 [Segetibacter sp. 3557_3]
MNPGKSVFFVLSSLLTILLFAASLAGSAQAMRQSQIAILNTKTPGAFPVVAASVAAGIYVDSADAVVVKIAAEAFKADVAQVSGLSPSINTGAVKGYALIFGSVEHSSLVRQLVQNQKLDVSAIRNKWETFSISVIDNPMPNVQQALVVAGSDPRGTAFGIFELSRMLGVQPFTWWADIVPETRKELFVTKGMHIVGPPSVKYRGIFINDEDWGLRPWAATTFEPEAGDIGPKTYAKVFELLLRLKANLIWPAMHPGTKPFYHYPGNKKAAADYAIVVGSSHAEPMLRNNVGEWNEKTMGHFNYLTNRDSVHRYWEERVKESSGNDAIYTLGMRGVHDSGIEGVKTPGEAVPLLERIIRDQRTMLEKFVGKDVTAVPQVFTAYKEVLDIYDNNLKIPDDVTLVWPDDNYGYIQRLSTASEQQRRGGSGVYYHASYWGRPHDYLWLSSTHPALIREEMMKAYEMKADRLWVLNVGDIKPLEYNIEMFMDMAFDVTPFRDSRYSKTHLFNWATNTFGKKHAASISEILWKYHQLAFERRPEFMGWSQTEPTTRTHYTSYNHYSYGDEAQQRIDRYEVLEQQVKALREKVSKKNQDAFFQLVYYPVVGASLMNKKFIYRDKAYLYSLQNRLSALDFARMSQAAYDSIVSETHFYNNRIASGKWKNMMSMAPRALPVYQPPVLPGIKINKGGRWGVVTEGLTTSDSTLPAAAQLELPAFDRGQPQRSFIDLFLQDEETVSWSAKTSANWIKLSKQNGVLTTLFGKKEVRVWVSIDWKNAPSQEAPAGFITFVGAGKEFKVEVKTGNQACAFMGSGSFVAQNGYVSIYASAFTRQTNPGRLSWQIIDGLGYTGKSLQVLPLITPAATSGKLEINSGPRVEYDFCVSSENNAELIVFTLPTHPLNNNHGMRYAVSLDDGPIKIIDFRTVGRSEEWKQNVLRNTASKTVALGKLNRGKHTLKIHAVDPGVVLDRIIINLGGYHGSYSAIPQTIPNHNIRNAPQASR